MPGCSAFSPLKKANNSDKGCSTPSTYTLNLVEEVTQNQQFLNIKRLCAFLSSSK